MTPDPLTYYAAPGPMTDPGDRVSLFDDLPNAHFHVPIGYLPAARR